MGCVRNCCLAVRHHAQARCLDAEVIGEGREVQKQGCWQLWRELQNFTCVEEHVQGLGVVLVFDLTSQVYKSFAPSDALLTKPTPSSQTTRALPAISGAPLGSTRDTCQPTPLDHGDQTVRRPYDAIYFRKRPPASGLFESKRPNPGRTRTFWIKDCPQRAWGFTPTSVTRNGKISGVLRHGEVVGCGLG